MLGNQKAKDDLQFLKIKNKIHILVVFLVKNKYI